MSDDESEVIVSLFINSHVSRQTSWTVKAPQRHLPPCLNYLTEVIAIFHIRKTHMSVMDY